MAPAIWVVWSFEHGAWWAPGRWGYTPELREAGRFTQREAEDIERDANVVAVNERALPWVEAQRHGPPRSDDRSRFHVVPDHNQHGGAGWAIFDREQQRIDGGWFADRIAAEQTAAVLNRSETS